MGYMLTPQQEIILKALVTPPYSVLVRAGHAVGKTFVAALAAAWFYDRYDPGICLCTAPIWIQVRDVLFKELRRIKGNDPDWSPKATRLESSTEHWIHGLTANKGDSFQGRHADKMMIIFDEASGVDMDFWERARTMVETGRKGHYFLAIYNPYDTSSPAYQAEQLGIHTILDMTAIDHPNVVQNRDIIPGAVSRTTIQQRINEECRLLEDGEENINAFHFAGRWYVPESTLFEVQVLGRWPSRSTASVWSDRALALIQEPVQVDPEWLVQIGCDPARFGDDRTAICVRKGRCVISMESHRSWSLDQTARRLKDLCAIHQTKNQPARQIPVLIDGAGLGAGLVDMRGRASDRYNFVEINSSFKSRYESEYTNLRSELWFGSADLAEEGQISIHGLDDDSKQQLMDELRQPVFMLDSVQRRMVEAKAVTKKRLRASPDLADAFNLACHLRGSGGFVEQVTGRV